MPYTQDNLYVSVTTPFGKDKLLFKSLQGEELISGLFHLDIEMLSETNTLDFSKIMGKNICVTMKFPDSSKRYFNGIVSRFVQAGGDARFSIYHAEVRPWLWFLTLTKNCRIFQNLSVPDIIKKVFNDLSFTDFRDALTGTYSKRVYCVQYEETAFDFVSRLMEDEGIYYFFEHEESKHTLVLADDLDAHKSCPSIDTARFIRAVANEMERLADAVMECQLVEQVTIGKYAVDDFNFETPSTDLDSSVKGTSGTMRVYEYPAGFMQKSDGETVAKRRIAAYEWENKLVEGQGTCFSLIAGYKFTLSEHPRDDMNAEYTLYQVSHSVSQEHYSNSFRAFPATTQFRAPIVTPKPKIISPQTAIVTGKSGEEIWTDKYGRIIVQFHWDQEGKYNENSSCWIRVNQGWAGKTWGNMWLPRIGQEVIVSFLNGNPDRPVITGAVYNSEQTVPYALPGEQTKSTIKSHSTKKATGFNELRFEDKKDSEEFYMHAQKDMVIDVLNNQTSTIKKNRTVTIEEENDKLTVAKGDRTDTIKKNRTVTIQEQDDTLAVEKGNRTVTIKKDDKLTVQDGDRTITVSKGKETHTIKGDYTIKVDGSLSIEVKGAITIKSTTSDITVKAAKSLTDKAGTTLTNKAGTSLTNQSGTDLTNKAGTSLTNKASMSMTNDAGMTLTNKGGLTQTVQGGTMVEVKGAIVKIN
ncbi:MAG: type VI secretion system tip protein VgrG [Gammaproteobacteria bacterium]|nr:type VI secretion system tip protein VgrG [Gammaproteobacteria bacterium]